MSHPHKTQKPPNPWAAACAKGPSCLAAGPSCPAAGPPHLAAGKVKFVLRLELASALPLPAHLGVGRGSSGGPGGPGIGVVQDETLQGSRDGGGAVPEPRKVPPRWRLSTRDKQPSHVSSSQRKRNPRRRSFSGEGRRH